MKKKLCVAMPAWEIGRALTGLGVKIGGMATIVEELPRELVKAAVVQNIDLEIEILSPCFAHYDKSKLKRIDLGPAVTLFGHTFKFEVYTHTFSDKQKVTYFWDQGQLHWTGPSAIYPEDPQVALALYASVSQAMAAYIKHQNFDTIHLHDYHVGLIPFYLGDEYLARVPVHFTIHNATYQGVIPLINGGYTSLDRINLPGEQLFHKYFDFFDNLNIMKACMLKVHETGGKITTVSGDTQARWGYAAELKQSHAALLSKAYAQKGSRVGEVFVPNRHLDLFEKLSIIGITNGLSERNRPENLPELKTATLCNIQRERGLDSPLFCHRITQREMLERDHNFDVHHLDVKAELKRLLHLECFGVEPRDDPILLTAVGRLVDQKNLDLVADIIERTLIYDKNTKFIILASAPTSDVHKEEIFFRAAKHYPDRVYFNNTFNLPLSKLIFAGGDFMLVPSKFEPCGLVDYEASLLGNVVIGRRTGGLAKVSGRAYLYEWLDMSDRVGEARAFFSKIQVAIDTYRYNPRVHAALVQQAMTIDASWNRSASQYVRMYQYGLEVKKWHVRRHNLIESFVHSLKDKRVLFDEFFSPATHEYTDPLDWHLQKRLTKR